MELLKIKDEAWKVVLTSFGKTEKTILKDVATLKNWIKTQPHLPEILEDKTIKNFLVLNQGDIETTKKKIDLYYTIRSLFPHLFEDINPKSANMKELMDIVYWTPLTQLTPEMNRVLFFKISKSKMLHKLEPINIIRQYINIQEIRLNEDIMYEEITVVDCSDVDEKILCKLTEELLSMWFFIFETLFSMRMQIYYFNAPKTFDKVVKSIESVVKPEFFERIHVCEDDSILYKHFSKEILPKDFGGQEKSLEELQDLLRCKLSKYQNRFDRLDKLRVNENLRPGQG